jgi:hypothetical protein
MGEAYSTFGREERCIQPEGRRLLGKRAVCERILKWIF